MGKLIDAFVGNLATRVTNEVLNQQELLQKGAPKQEAIAFYEDPTKVMVAAGYKDKPTSLSFDILRQMATKNSVIAAIITTRINQVSTFTKPSRFSTDGMGFQIRKKDPNHKPNPEELATIVAIEEFLTNTGYTKDRRRDSFDSFIRKIVRDSLTYDQLCFEIVPDKQGRPAEILAVDAATIRASVENFYKDYNKNSSEADYVQVIDGTIKASFSADELAFCIRNPRTDIRLQPYGFSELEQLITQITAHLYAEEYNSKFFSQGGTTKGILNIKGGTTMNQAQIEAFKSQWRAQVSGLTGAWKTPILQAPEGLEYINVGQSNREMEYNQWIIYLINVACAVYQIDPAEVNFPNNGGGISSGGGLMDGSQESKLKNSKDKGLRPLLRFIEDVVNENIVSRFDGDYVFNFVGLDTQSESEKAELATKQVKAFKTINEVRKEHGLEPLEDGDVILDPSYMNMKAMSGGGSPGEGGSPEDSGGDPYESLETVPGVGGSDNSDENPEDMDKSKSTVTIYL